MKALVAQSCLTLCDPMDCSLPGFSVHGILQAGILKWVDIPFSRGSSQLRVWTQASYIAGRFFTVWPTHNKSSKNVSWMSEGISRIYFTVSVCFNLSSFRFILNSMLCKTFLLKNILNFLALLSSHHTHLSRPWAWFIPTIFLCVRTWAYEHCWLIQLWLYCRKWWNNLVCTGWWFISVNTGVVKTYFWNILSSCPVLSLDSHIKT